MYDREYRRKIAADKVPWGTEFPFLAALHLREKAKSNQLGPNSKMKSNGGTSNKRFTCRLFNRGQCTYGNSCKFEHACSVDSCGQQHAAINHERLKNSGGFLPPLGSGQQN